MPELIRTNGTIEPITDMSLESLQRAVGGYIQIVDALNGKCIVMDEEGKLKGKPLNRIATKLYCVAEDHIVGDVVVAEQGEID